MHTNRVIFAVLASIVGFATLATAQAKADPREKLETAIPEAIRLLEAMKYETFLKTFVAPDDLKKILKEVSLEELAKQVGKDKATDLLQILKSVEGKEPTLDSEKKKATFKHETKGVPNKPLVFVKVDSFWYIKN